MLSGSFLRNLFPRRPDPEMGSLRDENIRLGTQVILLQDMVEHPRNVPRRLREERSDKRSVKDAYEAFHDRLRAELTPEEQVAARVRAKASIRRRAKRAEQGRVG